MTPGLYLLDNDKIAHGEKTAIAASSPRLSVGSRELIVKTSSGYEITGEVTLWDPIKVPLEEFDNRAKEHLVSKKQRMRWWPEAEELYVYPVTYTQHRTPVTIDLAPGAMMDVELHGVGVKEIAKFDGYYIYEVE